jgi:hypothetical protein
MEAGASVGNHYRVRPDTQPNPLYGENMKKPIEAIPSSHEVMARKEMTHYLISDDPTGPQMAAADALRRQLSRGLCLEKVQGPLPVTGLSLEAIENRSKKYRRNLELFHFRLNGAFSEAQEEAKRRLLAELGDIILPVKSSHFMIIMALVSIYLQELCDFDDDGGDYDNLIDRLNYIEEYSFFEEELRFDYETSTELLRTLRFFQAEPCWREDIQYALQYKLAYTYWICAAHMKDVSGSNPPMPAWEPFSETEVAETIDRLVDFIEVNREFMVIC